MKLYCTCRTNRAMFITTLCLWSDCRVGVVSPGGIPLSEQTPCWACFNWSSGFYWKYFSPSKQSEWRGGVFPWRGQKDLRSKTQDAIQKMGQIEKCASRATKAATIWKKIEYRIDTWLTSNAIKGTVHPKMKIQSLSSHPHADERFGEVF